MWRIRCLRGYQILHAGQILHAKPGARSRERASAGRWRLMRFMRHLGHRAGQITWWKRARRLIRCTIVPLIHRQARIDHANPRFATSRGQPASKGHDHPSRAAPSRAAPPAGAAARPAVRRRVRRRCPVRLRQPAIRPAAGRRTYRHRCPPDYQAGQPPATGRRRRGAHHDVVSPAAGGGAHRPDRVPEPVRCAAGHPGPGQRDTVVAGTWSPAGGAGLDPRPPAARVHPGRRRRRH